MLVWRKGREGDFAGYFLCDKNGEILRGALSDGWSSEEGVKSYCDLLGVSYKILGEETAPPKFENSKICCGQDMEPVG